MNLRYLMGVVHPYFVSSIFFFLVCVIRFALRNYECVFLECYSLDIVSTSKCCRLWEAGEPAVGLRGVRTGGGGAGALEVVGERQGRALGGAIGRARRPRGGNHPAGEGSDACNALPHNVTPRVGFHDGLEGAAIPRLFWSPFLRSSVKYCLVPYL